MQSVLRSLLLVVFAFGLAGCDDDPAFDKTPGEGRGGLIISNHLGQDLTVFVDGERLAKVRHNDSQFFEQDPGVRRIFLRPQGGLPSEGQDVDILVGRNTVVDVDTRTDLFDCRCLDVAVYLE